MSTPSKSADLPRGLIDRKGTPAGRSTRLPSIRGPRDLTLGGIPKKVFTPNIPSRRVKDDSTSSSPKSEDKSSHRRERNHSRNERGHGRGRGRDRDNYVQSHSIFEQGPFGEFLSHTKLSNYPSGSIGEGSGGKAYKTTFHKKESKEDTKRILDRLLQDDFVDSESHEDLRMQPVQLPLSSRLLKVKEEADVKPDVKSEPMEAETPDDTAADVKPPISSLSKQLPYDDSENYQSCEELFRKSCKSENGEMIFLQLPDVLPGIPPCQDEDRLKVKTDQTSNSSGTSAAQNSNEEESNLVEKLHLCSLNDFSEGYVGKLQTRKSGKAQLLLGNITLDVSMGTPCGFLQDLVSIRVKGSSGDLSVLGHVKHRLICTPNFESLVKTS